MSEQESKTVSQTPQIVKRPGKFKVGEEEVDREVAYFEGTRIDIWIVIAQSKHAENKIEARNNFIEDYPSLPGTYFDAAITYYQENQEEIEGDIKLIKEAFEQLAKSPPLKK